MDSQLKLWKHSSIRQILIVGIICSWLFSPSAQAMPLFLETGIGVSKSPTLNQGIGYHLGLLGQISFGPRDGELYVGILNRLSSATHLTQNLTTHLWRPYAALRAQFTYFFVTAGYSPFAWEQVTSSFSLSSFDRMDPGSSFFGELGVIWPIVPTFSLGLSAANTFISQSGNSSNAAIFDALFFMQFYLGSIGKEEISDAHHSPSDYEGWRYPYGKIR